MVSKLYLNIQQLRLTKIVHPPPTRTFIPYIVYLQRALVCITQVTAGANHRQSRYSGPARVCSPFVRRENDIITPPPFARDRPSVREVDIAEETQRHSSTPFASKSHRYSLRYDNYYYWGVPTRHKYLVGLDNFIPKHTQSNGSWINR